MILRPNAKINIGLKVVGKRSDGYHLLETCFYPIPLCDTLEINIAEATEVDSLCVQGDVEVGRTEDNLVLRAVRLLRESYHFPPLSIRLHKVIPSGAGLGGGSADATFTLRGINEMFALGATAEELRQMAVRLGADCPVFVDNIPAVGRGIGEVLSPFTCLELTGWHIVVVKPELHISTAEAFRGLKDISPSIVPLEERLSQPIAQWSALVSNDFEASLFPLHPQLAEFKARLYDLGAVYASMTGSGAALYGLFRQAVDLERAFDTHPNLFLWQSVL